MSVSLRQKLGRALLSQNSVVAARAPKSSTTAVANYTQQRNPNTAYQYACRWRPDHQMVEWLEIHCCQQ